MYYDFHYKAKITKIGEAIVARLDRIIAKEIFTLCGESIKLLEIGHGRGLFADILHQMKEKNKLSYHGIEYNKFLYEQGKKKGYNLLNLKIPPIPLKPDSFNVVYMAHVLEHFINYEIVLKVLKDIRKVLIDKGFFFLLFPDYLDYKEDYFSMDYSHEYILTRRRVEQLLIDSGFKLVKVENFRGCFKSSFIILLYPFFLTVKFVANILYLLTKRDIFFKMKITFGKNILIIAQKI